MSTVPLADVVAYLDDYLRIREVPDHPNAVNGLEVENRTGTVDRIVAAVDASLRTLDGQADRRTDGQSDDAGAGAQSGGTLLIVHHGMLWDGNVPITARRYRRVRALFDNNVALYAAHIPLDVHPEVGNNVVLAERLGVRIDGWWGEYRGIKLGVYGQVPHALQSRIALQEELGRILDEERGAEDRSPLPMLIPAGPDKVQRIGIITGAAGSMLGEASELGLDTFVTGEGNHHTWFDADELGINLCYAGHYATETLGVQALASHLSDQFDLPWEFHDHPTGL
ncbi:MAG TPA: Nif3-like dinuclear metal center hexameric protein [Gemmatimonadales bacterium]|jgi:dinuclear metal center YbgI/SA1388 family protein|nr:Nif3-like dinuclear metal center hexameric protein [Gemmatimonadales bacterium]